MGSKWGDWALPAPLLMIPIVSFLKFHDYPLLSVSALLALAVSGVFGMAAAAAIAIRPGILRPIVVALLAVFFFDIQFDALKTTHALAERFWGEPAGSGWIVFLVLLGVFAITSCGAALARETLTRVLAVCALTMFVATVVLPQHSMTRTVRGLEPGRPWVQPKSSELLPPIVHIVLDEHIGLAGFPEDIPGAGEARAALGKFYADRGFRIFSRAFSHYYLTEDALSYMVNGAIGPEHRRFVTESGRGFRLTENAWFEDLARRGYRLRVYQTDHVDFCASEDFVVEHCVTYPMAGLGAFSQSEIPVVSKMQGIFQALLVNSFLYRLAGVAVHDRRGRDRDPVDQAELAWSWTRPSAAPLAALDAAGDLVEDLQSAQAGTLYFAHLLIPHRAFILGPDCRMEAEPGRWHDHPTARYSDGRRISDSSRSGRYQAYFSQVDCSRRLVAAALDALDQAGLADDAIIVVHGDHGSRISVNPIDPQRISRLTDVDLRDAFSTLFAIRAPGTSPGPDDEVRSIHALFADLVMGTPLPAEDRVVFLGAPGDRDLTPYPFRTVDRSPIDRPRQQLN